MRFINLTPHALNIHTSEGVVNLPPSGEVARVAMTRTPAGDVAGIPTATVVYGEVSDLPAPVEGATFIVSGMVAAAVKREDVLSPGPLVRDEAGRPVGCLGLTRSV
jgi:hypothetical protein